MSVWVIVLLAIVALTVVGEVTEAAWGIGELVADLLDWIQEGRERRRRGCVTRRHHAAGR